MRMILVIFAALIVAGGTGYYVVQGLRPPAPEVVVEAEAPALRQVFVPSAELAPGTILTPMQLSRMDMTEAAITPEMIVADAEGEKYLAGSVARQVLPAGVPIARSAIVQPGDRGFLAAVLPKGMRAITIPVTETAGLNGLALPGDRVDLILTYFVTAKDDDGDDEAKPRDVHASETVARNLRLLALDNRVGPKTLNEDGEPTTPPPPKSATLQVTPRQAEEITLATTLGSLSLALNSVRDGGDDASHRPAPLEQVGLEMPALSRSAAANGIDMTLDSDVTSLLRLEVQKAVPEQIARIQVVRGRGSGVAAALPLANAAEAPEAAQAATPSAE